MARKIRIATGFTGGGVGLNRLDQSRYELVWGIEYDAKKATVYKMNYPNSHMEVCRIQDADFHALLVTHGPVDLWQVSPECKEFSSAKTDSIEGPEQLSQAGAICRGLRELKPKWFILENVRGYVHSESYRMIRNTLHELGYWDDAQVINSADFGVPQTRERLILRAVKDEMWGLPQMPAPVKWVGWYEAIEDLIPTLPESRFAKWQLEHLPDFVEGDTLISNDSQSLNGESRAVCNNRHGWPPAMTVKANSKSRYRAFLMRSDNTGAEWGKGYRVGEEPSPTLSANNKKPRAFIAEGQAGLNGTHLNTRGADSPVWTISASIDKKPVRAWLKHGKTVRTTPRALARFMSLSDDYKLPESENLACTIIGNGIPPLVLSKLIDGMVNFLAGEDAA